MASLRRVLRTVKEINRELREASGTSLGGPRGASTAAARADMAELRGGIKRIEKAIQGNPADLRRLF